MPSRPVVATLAALLLAAVCCASPARAENAMGYRLVTQQQADSLPRNNGALGMDVERARQITDHDLNFELMRVKSLRQGLPAARAGLRVGDQIISIDGRVFANLRAFAGYVGSLSPGQSVDVDFMPAGGGPQQAQRVPVVIGKRTGGGDSIAR
jgi:S1-C subfamily serine protease